MMSADGLVFRLLLGRRAGRLVVVVLVVDEGAMSWWLMSRHASPVTD